MKQPDQKRRREKIKKEKMKTGVGIIRLTIQDSFIVLFLIPETNIHD
jgi:hypothetical protein